MIVCLREQSKNIHRRLKIQSLYLAWFQQMQLKMQTQCCLKFPVCAENNTLSHINRVVSSIPDSSVKHSASSGPEKFTPFIHSPQANLGQDKPAKRTLMVDVVGPGLCVTEHYFIIPTYLTKSILLSQQCSVQSQRKQSSKGFILPPHKHTIDSLLYYICQCPGTVLRDFDVSKTAQQSILW